MAAASPFRLQERRIRLRDRLFVYLERTIRSDQSVPFNERPRAYGLSPSAVSESGTIIAAVAPEEAVWLGFQALDSASPVIVRVRLETPDPLDAVTGAAWQDCQHHSPPNYLRCPPDSRLAGIRQIDGYVPFETGQCFTVICDDEDDAAVEVELVAPEVFRSRTGIVPEPLDADNAYKGWRLP